jgi:two-component system response regulator GlrR
MIGQSKAFIETLKLIDRIAACAAPVLIEGETGTGKELAARAIHYQGARCDQPFVPVNCGAIPDLLIENELFGHRKGSFTDARDDQLGLIAHSHSGTLFTR